jgi:aminoglycoside phosphotransferase (APT) family kinase protein
MTDRPACRQDHRHLPQHSMIWGVSREGSWSNNSEATVVTAALGYSEDEMTDLLARWLRAQLSRAENLRVVGVSVPGNGASNVTGLIEAKWSLGGVEQHQRLVLRTTSAANDQLFESYDLAKQYEIMRCLGSTDIRVPRLLAYEGDPRWLGRDFYVMYNTGGQAVADGPPYHVSGWFAELSAAEQCEVWMQAVETIGAIHRLDWEALGLGFVASAEEAGDGYNDRFVKGHSRHLTWMERRNRTSYPRLRRVFDWLENNFPGDARTGLVWADAKLGNLMVDHTEIVGVLDWEHCTIGPVLYDLANWMVFDRLMCDGAGVPRARGLPERSQTLRRYENATGYSTEGIEYFELFSAVRLSNVTCGLAPGLIAAGLVPADFGERNAALTVMDHQLQHMGLDL